MRWLLLAWRSQKGQETWTGIKEKGCHLILRQCDFTSTSQRDWLVWTAHVQFCVSGATQAAEKILSWERYSLLSWIIDQSPFHTPRGVEFLKSCNFHLFQNALVLTNIASWASEKTYAVLKEGIILPLIESLCGPSLIYTISPEFRYHHLKQCCLSPACWRIFDYTVTMCLWQGTFWLV